MRASIPLAARGSTPPRTPDLHLDKQRASDIAASLRTGRPNADERRRNPDDSLPIQDLHPRTELASQPKLGSAERTNTVQRRFVVTGIGTLLICVVLGFGWSFLRGDRTSERELVAVSGPAGSSTTERNVIKASATTVAPFVSAGHTEADEEKPDPDEGGMDEKPPETSRSSILSAGETQQSVEVVTSTPVSTVPPTASTSSATTTSVSAPPPAPVTTGTTKRTTTTTTEPQIFDAAIELGLPPIPADGGTYEIAVRLINHGTIAIAVPSSRFRLTTDAGVLGAGTVDIAPARINQGGEASGSVTFELPQGAGPIQLDWEPEEGPIIEVDL